MATVNTLNYVYHQSFGRFQDAKIFRERFVQQLTMCNDVRRLKALERLHENDRSSLLEYISNP